MKLKKKLAEIKKISWVSPKNLMINCGMVIAFVAVFTGLIYIWDLFLSSVATIINSFI